MTRANPSFQLWYARHAPALEAGVCYGQLDIEVNQPATVAARALFDAFPPVSFQPTRVWSSKARRCADLARELSRLWGAELCLDERLSELSFGRWEGRRWSEIEANEADAWNAWMSNWTRAAPPGGEAPSEIEARARSFVESLRGSTGNVLIAHAGLIRALEVVLFERSWEDAMQMRIEHLRWNALYRI